MKMTKRCKRADKALEQARDLAGAHGICIGARNVKCGRRIGTLHCMMTDRETGKRIVDYWPTTGTWYCHATGEKGKVATFEEAIGIAIEIRYAQLVG